MLSSKRSLDAQRYATKDAKYCNAFIRTAIDTVEFSGSDSRWVLGVQGTGTVEIAHTYISFECGNLRTLRRVYDTVRRY